MTDDYRLPPSVRPTAYRLAVRVDLERGRLDTVVDIDVELAEPTGRLELHALDLEIHEVAVGQAGELQPANWSLDHDRQTLVVATPTPLGPGAVQLHVSSSTKLGEHLVGCYRSTYRDGDDERALAVTQFEAAHARRAFPCFDEPSFKASFAVTLDVAEGLTAVANGPELARRSLGGGRVAIEFAPTIPMSTYLVAWVVGPLVASEPRVVRGVPIRVVHRPGLERLTGLALDAAAHAVEWFEDHFGIPFPDGKLDLIAVPDFAFGAMENLGCITFREVLLLADPTTATTHEREDVALVVAHEIAHMWFGDLVTMEWWDGIWLNEAFATHLELLCTDHFDPDLDVWTSFGLNRGPAFEVDSTAATRPIHYPVNTPDDADGMFDVLTYEKGASVLRMVEQHVGEAAWRAGTRRYLGEHLYGNTTADHLWTALGAVSGEPVGEVLETWIEQGGHPTVTASKIPGGLRISQRRTRRLGGDAAPEVSWAIPVAIRGRSVDGEPVERRTLLQTESLDLDLGTDLEWVIANAGGHGFYRCRYSGDLGTELLGATEELSPLERFSVLDDAIAALSGGSATLAELEATLHAVAGDDAPVWRLIAGFLRTLSSLTSPQDRSVELAGSLVGDGWRHAAALAVRGSDTDAEELEIAAHLLRIAAIRAGIPDAVDAARSLLEADPPGELLAAATEVLGAVGDATDAALLWSTYRSAGNPQIEARTLRALAGTGRVELQQRLLDRCLEEIRPQNVAAVVSETLRHPQLGGDAWRWLTRHWDMVLARIPANAVPVLLRGVTTLCDPEAAAHADAFLAERHVEVGEKSIAQYRELLRAHHALRIALAAERS